MFKYIASIFCYLMPFWGLAQLTSPEGGFLQKSMKVGEKIPYALYLKYPDDQTIVFPDSSYDFFPFELVDKQYSPTVSSEGFSFDSVVYYLQSFEIDSFQVLRLPIYVIEGGDSVTVYTQRDTIFLEPISVAATDPLQETAEYREVPLLFNYPYLIAAVIILALIIMAVLLIFGKQIRQRIALYRLKKAHEKFIKQYDANILEVEKSGTKVSAEATFNFWKRYMERLERIPYTKLTTKELSSYHRSTELQNAMRNMDKNIYGRFKKEEAYHDLLNLKEFAQERYEAKAEEVKAK